MLQTIGCSGWEALFRLRDLYVGQSYEHLSLVHINAVAGLILVAGLRYVYRAIWDKPMLIRVVLVLIASYIVAAI